VAGGALGEGLGVAVVVPVLAAEPEAPPFLSSFQPIIAAHSNSTPSENFFMRIPFVSEKPVVTLGP